MRQGTAVGSGMTSADKKALRLRLMDRIYELANGATFEVVDPFAALGDGNVSRQDIFATADYLVQEGLLDWEGRLVSLTHRGVLEVEQAIDEPDQPTQHFPPMNVAIIGRFQGAFQQGTTNSQQTVAIGLGMQAVRAWVDTYRAAADGLAFGDGDRQRADDALDAIDSELTKANPDPARIRLFGNLLLGFVLSMVSNAATAAILGQSPFGPN